MNSNSDVEIWRLSWKTEEIPVSAAFDVRREGRRQERRLRAKHIFELGFAVVLIAFAGIFLRVNFSTETLIWAIVIWTTTMAATAFSVWNWRVLWEAAGQSTTEYVAAYRTRCMAGLRAVRFGFGLLAVQLLITVPWLTWDFSRHTLSGTRYAVGMGLLALTTAALIAMLVHHHRSALAELGSLEEFQRSLSED